MYPSLLVPLDGSHFSEHALPVAAGIARRRGSPLSVVRVHTSASLEDDKNAEAADAQTWQEEQTYLRGIVHRLAGALQVQAHPSVLNGEVADSLLGYIRDEGIDLVVMTTHGRGLFSRLWLGSVADELLRRLPTPLLLIRPQTCLPTFSRTRTFRNILVPLDGSSEAEEILEPALALDRSPETAYTLLRVVVPPEAASDPRNAGDLAQTVGLQVEAQRYLDRIAARWREEQRVVHIRIRTHLNPAVGILEEIGTGFCDLVALTTHVRSGLNRFLVSSVTQQVIRKAVCPVLTVKTPRGSVLEWRVPSVAQPTSHA